MTSLFISHSSRDQVAAQRVHQWLRNAGYQALFLDFDLSIGIPAGRRWEGELYAQLRRTDGVIFLASADSVASKWCFAELSLARSLGRPVFSLRLDRAAWLDLLQDVQWVDLTADETAFGQLRDGLHRAGLRPGDSFAWDPDRSPFPGLEPFDGQDAAVFFGREQEIGRLMQLLTTTLLRGRGRFVAIAGPSGSGKSSLLRAGLLPRLERLADRWVVVPPMQPGRQPLQSLARSLQAAFRASGHERTWTGLLDRLGQGPASLIELGYELGEATGGAGRSVLLVVDQAEELLTRNGLRGQEQFLALLRGALQEDSPLWAIATLRAEFLSSAPDRAGLAEAIDDPLLIEPLSRARLPEIIERPAQRAGLDFAPGLVQRMVEDTTGGDALPLLAWTLQQLYHDAGPGPERKVTTEAYEALGGVVGSLQRQANLLTDELHRRGHGALVLPTLLKCVTIDEADEPTRRRVERRQLPPVEDAIVQAFVDARLLTSNRADEKGTVEVAHEALLRQWPPLRQAILDAQEGLRIRSQVERLASDWERGGHDESYLLRGTRLVAFEAWAGQHPDDLSAVDRRFLDASKALADRERAADLERQRSRQAQALSRAAETAEDPALALLLAVEVLQRSADAQTDRLVRMCLHHLGTSDIVPIPTETGGAEFARARQRLTLSDWTRGPGAGGQWFLGDAEIRFAVDERGRALHGARTVIPMPAPVVVAAYVRAGIACLGTESGELAVWQLAGPAEKVGGRDLGVPITSVAVSQTAQALAVACDDNNIRVLHVEDLSDVECLASAGFTRDLDLGGDLVAALSHDRRIRVWDLVSQEPACESAAPKNARRLAIDGDGEYVIFGDSEPSGRVPLSVRALTAWARQAAGRSLTTDERQRYIDDPLTQQSTAAEEA
ncbi:MAG: TIR domain-containing protein [Streptosporangiaceae bacterium]